jgi:uncharacterized OsmC-like protein
MTADTGSAPTPHAPVQIEWAGITAQQAARAVELSVTKYCSVRSSLIADAPVTWTIEVKT